MVDPKMGLVFYAGEYLLDNTKAPDGNGKTINVAGSQQTITDPASTGGQQGSTIFSLLFSPQ